MARLVAVALGGGAVKLWLVRHAQPLVAAGICYGRLDLRADAGATAECAKNLAALLPSGCRVISSPLQRCEQLAQALHALRPDLAYKTEARLQEMDFGRWEGQPWQAIGRDALQAWTDEFAHHAAGGNGESVSRFMARVGAAFDALGTAHTSSAKAPAQPLAPARAHQGSAPANDTVWITHAGVIRAVQLLAQGIRQVRQAGDWPLQAPEYGQWQLLDLYAG